VLARVKELEPVAVLRDLRTFLSENAPESLHLNACGDFQLMAREHWLDLRGYPEFPLESPSIESLLSMMAPSAGLRECVLPPQCCVFRLERETEIPNVRGRDNQCPADAVRGPRLDERTVFIWGAYMRWIQRPMVFNGSAWGLGSEHLSDIVACSSTVRPVPRVPSRRHRVFEQFEEYEGFAEPGFERGFYGVNVRDWLFTGEPRGSLERQRVRVEHPGVSEEYFEWVALLVALTHARKHFCIAELGAGWGRWIASAAVLCRQRGLDYRLIGIEAETSHFDWMKMVLRDNQVDPDEHQIRFGAVAAQEMDLLLAGPNTPKTVYGHRTIRPEEVPDWQNIDGTVFQAVPGVTIRTLLKDEPFINLMDLDVQGAEYDVLASSFDVLDAKVQIVHIGTHGRAIEADLSAVFQAHGWLNAFMFSCQSHAHTVFGEVDFGDGVQTWVNPKWPELLPALLDVKTADLAPETAKVDAE
jgi:FkbM family methyltransferase